MSQSASPRSKKVVIAVVAVAVIAVAAFAVWRLGDDGSADPVVTRPQATEQTSEPTTEPTTPSPTPSPTPTDPCEDDDTQFNVEGTEQESLLPDCGVPTVTLSEQQASGLGLACGGSYPVILYKTTTTDAKTSICGTTSSGEEFRLVTKADGGEVLDLPGSYDPQLDAFVAKKGGTSYTVLAYDGSLIVRKDGSSTTQKSSDWISLDNESDYD